VSDWEVSCRGFTFLIPMMQVMERIMNRASDNTKRMRTDLNSEKNDQKVVEFQQTRKLLPDFWASVDSVHH
jgi:hypothetical protein